MKKIKGQDSKFMPAGVASHMPLPFLFAEVPAGFPSPADDFVEDMLDFNTHFIKTPSATFWKRVRGTSMIDAGIMPGGYILIDRSIKPATGHIAVCWIDGEFTCKELRVEEEVIWLIPKNEKFAPIKVTKDNEFVVWGIVIGCYNPMKV